MRFLKYVPLFGWLWLLYNIIVLVAGADVMNAPMSIGLPSGADLELTLTHIFTIIGIFCLYVEIIKSAKRNQGATLDHALSMIIFVLFLLQFVLFRQAGTAAFLLLGLMSFVDVLAGFMVSLSTARRDFYGNLPTQEEHKSE